MSYYPQNVSNLEKQPKTMMLQINAAAVLARPLICDDTPRQAWWRQKEKQPTLYAVNKAFPTVTFYCCTYETESLKK